jgi:phosphate transport system substrate-binding protein
MVLAVFLMGALQLPVGAADVLTTDFQGPLKIGGTGAALGAITQVVAAFQKKHPKAHCVIPPSLGSTGGINAVIAGALDLGLSSRPLTEAERRQGAVAFEYARTPFLLVTSHQVAGVNFTLKQVASLYAEKSENFPMAPPCASSSGLNMMPIPS